MQRMCTFALREKCPNISGPYFPAFGLNTGKYGPEIPPYLDTFHAGVTIRFATQSFTFLLQNFTC